MNRLSAFFVILAFGFGANAHGTNNIQFLSGSNLLGRYTDELPKSSDIGRFTQPLLANLKMALEYRVEGEHEYVLLLESQEGGRWKIVDAFLVPKHSVKESISFACSIAGGPPPSAGTGSLGIIRHVKRSQVVTATRGWRVNLKRKKLEPVRDKKTICDLHGVD